MHACRFGLKRHRAFKSAARHSVAPSKLNPSIQTRTIMTALIERNRDRFLLSRIFHPLDEDRRHAQLAYQTSLKFHTLKIGKFGF